MGRGSFPEIPHVYLSSSREADGLSRWEFDEQAFEDFLALKSTDREAFAEIRHLLERWGRRGATGNEPALVEPSGTMVFRKVKSPPWLGEIKGFESPSAKRKSRVGTRAQYRLYFIDIAERPGEPEHQMLIVLCKEKRLFGTSLGDERKANAAQNRDIIRAMEIGKRWCAERGMAYRPWPTGT